MLIKYNLPITIFKEGDVFIAYTPVLDFSTSGKTFEEVKKRFCEGVQLFLEELEAKGTLDEVFTELGWQKKAKSWQPPAVVAHTAQEINFSAKSGAFSCSS